MCVDLDNVQNPDGSESNPVSYEVVDLRPIVKLKDIHLIINTSHKLSTLKLPIHLLLIVVFLVQIILSFSSTVQKKKSPDFGHVWKEGIR